MGKYMVYNYTPIPLMVNQYFVMPDQFVMVFGEGGFTVQNVRSKECKGVKVAYEEKLEVYYLYCEGYIIDYAGLYYEIDEAKEFSHQFIKNGLKFSIYLLADADDKIKVRIKKHYKSQVNIKCSAFIKPAVGTQLFQLQDPKNSLCDFQTYGYLSNYTGNPYKDFKKIIEVGPRYILSNTTNYKVKICQINSQ